MTFRMACPKCGSTNLTSERDGGSYVRGGAFMVKCYMCGKMIYGEQNIEAEYKKQLKGWKASQAEKDTLVDHRAAQVAAMKKAEDDARQAAEEATRIRLAEQTRKKREEVDRQKAERLRVERNEREQKKRRMRQEREASLKREAETRALYLKQQAEAVAKRQREEEARRQEAELRALEETRKREEEARLQILAEQQRIEEERKRKAEEARQVRLQEEKTQRELDIVQAAKDAVEATQAKLTMLDGKLQALQTERDTTHSELEKLQHLFKKAQLPVLRRESAKHMAALRAGDPPPRILVVCSHCEEPFHKLPGDAKKNKSGHFYCCPEHLTLWRRAQKVQTLPTPEPAPVTAGQPKLIAKPMVVKGRVQMSCAHCGIPVYKTPGDVKRSKTGHFFCCRDHHQLWLKDHPDVFRQMALKQAADRRATAPQTEEPVVNP